MKKQILIAGFISIITLICSVMIGIIIFYMYRNILISSISIALIALILFVGLLKLFERWI